MTFHSVIYMDENLVMKNLLGGKYLLVKQLSDQNGSTSLYTYKISMEYSMLTIRGIHLHITSPDWVRESEIVAKLDKKWWETKDNTHLIFRETNRQY